MDGWKTTMLVSGRVDESKGYIMTLEGPRYEPVTVFLTFK